MFICQKAHDNKKRVDNREDDYNPMKEYAIAYNLFRISLGDLGYLFHVMNNVSRPIFQIRKSCCTHVDLFRIHLRKLYCHNNEK